MKDGGCIGSASVQLLYGESIWRVVMSDDPCFENAYGAEDVIEEDA